MEKKVQDELNSMIHLAIKKELIPKKTYIEIEFTVDINGQASYIEYWPTEKRLACNRSIVEIPEDLINQFVFSKTVVQ